MARSAKMAVPVVIENMPLVRIIEAVAMASGVSVAMMCSRVRVARVVRAKQAVAHLGKEAGRSSSQIAKALALTDHSTILHHQGQARIWLERDADFRRVVASARWVLERTPHHQSLIISAGLAQQIARGEEEIALRTKLKLLSVQAAKRRQVLREEEGLPTVERAIRAIERERVVRKRNALAHDDVDAVRRKLASEALGRAISASGGGFR